MLVLPHFVAYEVCQGWGYPVQRFTARGREAAACYLWQHCHQRHGASLRALTVGGIECGTPRPGDQHGVHGVLMERCADCEQMFTTATVGASLCPGCELLTVGYATLARDA